MYPVVSFDEKNIRTLSSNNNSRCKNAVIVTKSIFIRVNYEKMNVKNISGWNKLTGTEPEVYS